MDAFGDNFLYFDASFYKVGGMLAIQRYGQNASTLEDNLTLTYNGMKLASVTGTIGGQTIDATFTYDACGRTLTDGVSKLNYQYNLLGALTAVANAGTLTPTTLSTYRHLADGTKYMTVSAGNNGALLYRGPLTFTIADVTATTPAISFLRAETGSTGAAIIASATGSGAAPYFYVTDQLGSVRAVVDSQGSVVERNDYYTYGKRHTTGRTYADLKNSPLLFSGKEDQGQALDIASGTTTPSNLRILDFGARHYDPIVPRWTTPDPLAEKYFPINPYAYCAGDPVNLVDPEGMDWYRDSTGNYIWVKSIDKTYIDRDGNTWINCGTELVFFDGVDVTYLKQKTNNGVFSLEIDFFGAVSGRPINGKFDYSFKRQAIKGKGPTPERDYYINPDEIEAYSDLPKFQALLSLFGRGRFPWGTRAWGNYRVPLHPKKVFVYNENGEEVERSNMYMHGGLEPGSAGCIDMHVNADRFFLQLMKSKEKQIPVVVNYRNNLFSLLFKCL